MNELTFTRLWGMRLTFALIVFVILFFHLLPIETSQGLWVGPDLILAFALAWSARRPDFVPAMALAVLFLLADLLLFRPPGLWAALALLACESMKSRAHIVRDGNFLNEWLTVCALLTFVALGYRAILLITLLDLPPFGLSVFELGATMVFYPVAAAVTHGLLGVRHPAPGELENARGQP